MAAAAVLVAATVGAHQATRRERRIIDRQTFHFEDARRRLAALEFSVSQERRELQDLVGQVAAGNVPAAREAAAAPAAPGDAIAHLAHSVRQARTEAWNAVVGVANAKPAASPMSDSSPGRVGVFVSLARRIQSLSHRVIQGLDELEDDVEDPDLLKGLFRVDHLSTRLRRQAESLAVIGGGVSRRQWSRPVTVHEVLRAAIAEVEQFSRVKVARPVEGTLDGGAVADVVHLLAELVENATRFSPPHTQVLLRAETVTAGIAIEIEDRGLGIPRETQHRLNDILADPERNADINELVRDGRIGLLVVSALSRRHRIAVRLQSNIFGGTQVVLVLPNEIVGKEKESAAARAAAAQTATTTAEPVEPAPVPVSTPMPAPVPEADGQRPELPRRRPQESIAAELVNVPAPPPPPQGAAAPQADTEKGHRHDLMAAFRKGMRSGEDEEPEGQNG